MRVCLLTSTSRRHAYLARRLAQAFELTLTVREDKGLDRTYETHPDREIIESHFEHLAEAEREFFPDDHWGADLGPRLDVARGELNTAEVHARLVAARPEVIAVFGCGLIKPPVLGLLPETRVLNIHQGLSPYYRGSGTNFWPFVERRPQFIGVTLHTIDAGTDTGGILAHGRPDIAPGDGLHRLGMKTIAVSADLLCQAIAMIGAGTELEPIPQWGGGRLFKRKDMDGTAIRELRRLEADRFIDGWLADRDANRTEPVRLLTLQA